MILQLVIGQELEVVAGWLRVAILYLLSSVAGLAVSAAIPLTFISLAGQYACYAHMHYCLLT